jgi:copper chaperone
VAPGTDEPPATEEIAMPTETYTVTGMTCGHCVSSVSSEIGKIDGVSDVQVDLSSGIVTVTSQQPLDDAAVRAAVDEAGYEVAAR